MNGVKLLLVEDRKLYMLATLGNHDNFCACIIAQDPRICERYVKVEEVFEATPVASLDDLGRYIMPTFRTRWATLERASSTLQSQM